MGRILAVDWGDRRIGLAATDPLRIIASPLGAIQRRAGKRPPVAELLRQAESLGDVDLVVIGLPLDPAGDETPRCAEVRDVARKVTERSGLPVVLVDERFTTAKALRAIQEMGGSTRGRKEDVDALAATVLLQQALSLGVSAADAERFVDDGHADGDARTDGGADGRSDDNGSDHNGSDDGRSGDAGDARA